MFENTIAAISTSLQDGAISIIRLSGDQAIEITQKIFDRNIMNAKSHTIHYGFIIDQYRQRTSTPNCMGRPFCINPLPIVSK